MSIAAQKSPEKKGSTDYLKATIWIWFFLSKFNVLQNAGSLWGNFQITAAKKGRILSIDLKTVNAGFIKVYLEFC